MGSTTDFRPGLVIRYNNDLYQIVEFQHVNPGNWRAFVRAKMRNIKTGRVIENRFRAGESVDVIRVERNTFQYLYREGNFLVLMDNTTFEQTHVPIDLLGDGFNYLKENVNIDLLMNGTEIVSVEIPIFVELLITQTEPGEKGNTVTGATKQAIVETGATVYVPLFLNEGDKIKVDTRTGQYVERIK